MIINIKMFDLNHGRGDNRLLIRSDGTLQSRLVLVTQQLRQQQALRLILGICDVG